MDEKVRLPKSNLISAAELHDVLGQPDVVVVDGSWYLPTQGRNPLQEFLDRHIPSAQFFDIDQICDLDSTLPHMVPDTSLFEKKVRELGINNDSRIVVYDGAGIFSAPRVWWLFRLFGHTRIRVLNGGLPQWLDKGYDTEVAVQKPGIGNFTANPDMTRVATMEDMRKNAQLNDSLVLDARSYPRFVGEAPEPRAELPSGHMPNSKSLAFTELLEGGKFRDVADLGAVLRSRGASKSNSIITSCGSGVTAAVITLALDECGFGLQRLYDGSWTEWASHSDNPIVKQS